MDKIFHNENVIAVAVSGGLDSVCLLHMCVEYAKETGKQVAVLHIHHGLRAESDAEEKFVEKLAKSYKAKFSCEHVNVLEKKSVDKQTTEEAARELRYMALAKLAKKNGANYICLAHNANDQAETVLLHLVRGSGLKGACAMSEISGQYVRPILNLTRSELEKYAKQNGLEHVEDASNENTEYSRNFIRHNVLPQLEKLQPKAAEHLAMFASRMQDVNDYIKAQTPEPQIISKNEVLLKETELSQLIFANQVYQACAKLGVYKDIEDKHIKDILALFEKQNGVQIHLPHGLTAWKTQSGVIITNIKPKIQTDEVAFAVGKINFGGKKVEIQPTSEILFGDGLYVDALKIPPDSVIRTPRDGDRFQKLGAKGGKKLADYFTDKKIPLHKRASMLVVASKSGVVAVLGYDISEGAKIDDQTEQILKITIEEGK